METPRTTRPTVVTVLGVIFIVFASFGLFVSFMMVLGDLLIRYASTLPGHALPAHRGLFQSPQGYLWELYGLATAVAELVAAIAFLGLRAWGRAVLEALEWLSAAVSVGFIIWLTAHLERAGAWTAGHPDLGGLPSISPAPFSTTLGLISSCVTLAIACVLLYFLRSRTVREAMRP